MRIVSGFAGGIRLEVPKDDGVRPTEDKVKESLFATLGDLRGARVLDLFSGTGALGLEALSRGASKVVSVEVDRRHCEVIQRNHAAVRKAMGDHADEGEYKLLSCDARTALKQLPAAAFDFILADPPYHAGEGQFGGVELLQCTDVLRVAAEGAILVLEHATDTRGLPWFPVGSWRLLKERSFGIRTIAFARGQTQEEK